MNDSDQTTNTEDCATSSYVCAFVFFLKMMRTELHHRFGHLLCSCSPQCHYDHVASFPATTFNFKPELGQPINPDTNVRITLLT